MANLNYSRQREFIKENLRNRYDHPTAEMVFAEARKAFPKVSLATVYRNLGLLADLGEIRHLVFPGGPDRWDGNLSPHDHFICRDCGAIIDLEKATGKPVLMRRAAERFDGVIEDCSVNFHGLCPACAKAKKRATR